MPHGLRRVQSEPLRNALKGATLVVVKPKDEVGLARSDRRVLYFHSDGLTRDRVPVKIGMEVQMELHDRARVPS